MNIYLQKSIVGFISLSTEGIDIKTFRFSTGIEYNVLTMETEPFHYIWIEKVFDIYYVIITFCT